MLRRSRLQGESACERFGMGNIGFGELLLILIVLLLIFGTSKLPALGDALGRGIKNFKKATTQDDAIDVTPRKDALPEGKSVPAGSEKTEEKKV